MQWTRAAFYLYGIVEPRSGEHFFLECSHLDTVCFEQFLAQFVQAYPDDIHIIQVDQGRFHSCELLHVPESVILLFQPAHSQATFWGNLPPKSSRRNLIPSKGCGKKLKST